MGSRRSNWLFRAGDYGDNAVAKRAGQIARTEWTDRNFLGPVAALARRNPGRQTERCGRGLALDRFPDSAARLRSARSLSDSLQFSYRRDRHGRVESLVKPQSQPPALVSAAGFNATCSTVIPGKPSRIGQSKRGSVADS